MLEVLKYSLCIAHRLCGISVNYYGLLIVENHCTKLVILAYFVRNTLLAGKLAD